MASRSRHHPGGIGGSSGILGRYLMDHSAGNVYFYMPDAPMGSRSFELRGADSILVPRYQNLGKSDSPHLRGFGIWGGIQRLPMPAFLHKRPGVACGFLCARSESIPHFDNHVRLSATVRDAWGIPAAHIECSWRPEDLAIAAAGRQAATELVEAAGGVIAQVTDLFHTPFVTGHIRRMQKEWQLSTPGMFVHEVGGARMGADPGSSVVDSWCRTWDVPNLLVTDGACWPTSGWQNPTLTQMAITARACDRAIADARDRVG
jgi:choline dehydrogenase-like flavoprotein